MLPSLRARKSERCHTVCRAVFFVLALSGLTLAVSHRTVAQTSQYTVTQVTSGAFDHMWPAINNKGDIVWSQQVNGLWQVFKQPGVGGNSAPIAVPDPAHNFQYPDISDSGNILYLKDTSGQGAGLQVILNQQGVESIIELSSSNVGAFRNAGQHFGISKKNGTTVSYYDFCSGGCVRRFDVSGVGTLQCGGVNCDFGQADYPDINDKGVVAYFDPTTGFISEFTVPNVNPAAIVAGSFARINNPGDLVVVSAGQVQVYLAPSYTNSKFVNAGNWAGINDLGVVVFQAADSTRHQQIYKAVPINSVILLDPVPDLLCGQAAVVDPAAQCGSTIGADQLATQGQVVYGVAADGVTQAVIRIPTTSIGDQFTLTLMNDGGQVSGSTDDDGGLANIGGSSFSNQITITATSTTFGPIAFASYRAPIDFPRAASPVTTCGGVAGTDSQLACRLVSIKVQASSTGATNTTPVTILRPPVLLVHGFWDSQDGWSNFLPLFSPTVQDSRFHVARANYGNQLNLSVTASAPSYPFWITTTPMASTLGVEFNAPSIPAEVALEMYDFKTGNNPEQIPAAAVQVDIVAHSLGGLLSRWLPFEPGYLANNTFGQGSIHKLITIDTPHRGTPAATDLLLPSNTCVRTLLAKVGNLSYYTATLSDGTVVNGGVGDMEGDGSGGALNGPAVSLGTGQSALQVLAQPSPHPVPTAMIAGIMTSGNLNGLNNPTNFQETAIIQLCGLNPQASDPLALALNPTAWRGVFGQDNDGIVPLSSQLNGTAPIAGLFFNGGYVHSEGIEKLGFAGPAVYPSPSDPKNFPVSQWQAVPNEVINLLNTSVKNSVFKSQ